MNRNNLPNKFKKLCNDDNLKRNAVKIIFKYYIIDFICLDKKLKIPFDDKELLFCIFKKYYLPFYTRYHFNGDKILINASAGNYRGYWDDNDYQFKYSTAFINIKKYGYNIPYFYNSCNFNGPKKAKNIIFIHYCVKKYGIYNNNFQRNSIINNLTLKLSNGDRYFYQSIPIMNTLLYNNNENFDKLYSLIKYKKLSYMNMQKIIPYFFQKYTFIYTLLNNNDLFFLKLIYNSLINLKSSTKINNRLSYNIIMIPNNVNILFKLLNTFVSIDIDLNFKMNYSYNKKNLEKIFFYNSDDNNLIHSLDKKCYIRFLKKNNKIIKNIDNEYFHKLFDQNEIEDNDKMLNFIKNKKFSILPFIKNLKNDKEIVIESLKNDQKMIYYCGAEYINKYVEFNYDMKKLIHYLENNVESH